MTEPRPTRAVITLATTKPIFVEMAFALARSFFYWNRDPDLGFHLVTDLAFELPADLEAMQLIRVESGKLGVGFSPKLLNLGPLPNFNGGLYYLERGSEVTALYQRARALETQYDEIGLIRLRGRPNDEILIALAMAERGFAPVPEDGTILGNVDTIYPIVEQLDVLGGICRMTNPPPPDPRHVPGHPVSESLARIVHFLDYGTDKWPYRAEELKIRLVQKHGLPVPLARLAADAFKETFRPAYRRLFGARRIKTTEKSTI